MQGFCKGATESTSSMTQPWNDSAVLEMGNCYTYEKNGRCSVTDLDYQEEENLFLLLAKLSKISSPIFVTLSLCVSVIYI